MTGRTSIKKSLLVTVLIALSVAGCASFDFGLAKNQDTAAAYRHFIKYYPEHELAERARARIAEIEYEEATKEDTVKAYESYLEEHAGSAYDEKAREELAAARERDVLAASQKEETLTNSARIQELEKSATVRTAYSNYGERNVEVIMSLGYGSLEASNIVVAGTAGDVFEGEDWDVFNIGIGVAFNSRKTQLYFDFLLSETKDLDYSGTRPLVGGGVTHVSAGVGHGGVFLALRQELIDRLYVNSGIGAFWQEKKFTYSPAVANRGGGGGSEEVWGWFLGPDIELTDGLLFGAKFYKTLGDPSSDEDFEIEGTVFNLTFLF